MPLSDAEHHEPVVSRAHVHRMLDVSNALTGIRPPRSPRDDMAQAMILDLVQHGYLVGVEVFGTDSCCTHGDQIGIDEVGCESTGYGLCDRFGPHSVGSDCNRADLVLMRPSDALDFDAIHTALTDETANGKRNDPAP